MEDDKGFGQAWKNLKESWKQIKRRGFNTGEASTEINDPNEDKSKLSEDLKLSPMERKIKARKGFLGE